MKENIQKQGPINNISQLWSMSDKEHFGINEKSSSQYGIYQKNSSGFGISYRDMEINNNQYLGKGEMVDLIADKISIISVKNIANIGSSGINPWILDKLVREEIELKSMVLYFESKLHLVPTSYLLMFKFFKDVIIHTKRVTKRNLKDLRDDDFINANVLEAISNIISSESEAMYFNQYLAMIAPLDKEFRIVYKSPTPLEDINHPLVHFFAKQLRLKGTKEESIKAANNHIRDLFIWLTENIDQFKKYNINKIVVNLIDEQQISDYINYQLRLVREGKLSEGYVKIRISRIKTFLSILFQKKRISRDIAARIHNIRTEDYKYRGIPKENELKRLFEIIYKFSDEPDKEITAFSLMLYMGFRGLEVAKLKWEDINLGNKTLVINDSKRSSSKFPVPSNVEKMLLKIQEKTSGYVFSDEPVRYRNQLYNNYKVYTLIAGWNYEGGLHLLRHTFITYVTKYSPLVKIQDLSRHKTGNMPSRYIHLEREYVKGELLKLDLIEGDLK